MARQHHSSLVAVFEEYGDDASAALAALANLDPPLWSSYVEAAAEKQYRSDYANHRSKLLRLVKADAITAKRGQPRLFEPPESTSLTALREVLVLDGVEYKIAGLAGEDGAAVLRRVATRDLGPATTTVNRCKLMLALADHVAEESKRRRRPVAVAEVLPMEAAA